MRRERGQCQGEPMVQIPPVEAVAHPLEGSPEWVGSHALRLGKKEVGRSSRVVVAYYARPLSKGQPIR